MRQLKRLASSPYFKAVAGTVTLGGLGYAAYYQTTKATAEIITCKIIEQAQEAQTDKDVVIPEAEAIKK